jgi:hypothetical protein
MFAVSFYNTQHGLQQELGLFLERDSKEEQCVPLKSLQMLNNNSLKKLKDFLQVNSLRSLRKSFPSDKFYI